MLLRTFRFLKLFANLIGTEVQDPHAINSELILCTINVIQQLLNNYGDCMTNLRVIHGFNVQNIMMSSGNKIFLKLLII